MNAIFEQIVFEDDILDCEPEYVRHEQETVKTTQLLTAEQAEELLAKNHGIVHKRHIQTSIYHRNRSMRNGQSWPKNHEKTRLPVF